MEAIGRLKEKATRHGREPSHSPHRPARSCRPSQHDLIPAAPRRAPAPHLDVGQPTPRRPPPRCRRCWRAGPAATPPLLPSPLRVGRAALGGRSSVGARAARAGRVSLLRHRGQLTHTEPARACRPLPALWALRHSVDGASSTRCFIPKPRPRLASCPPAADPLCEAGILRSGSQQGFQAPRLAPF